MGCKRETGTGADWTRAESGVSNASPEFLRMVEEVDRLIRHSGGHVLARNWSLDMARLIMAQLAHQHGLAPQPSVDRVQRLEDVVRDLADGEPCRFDHHGYCQAHGWLTDGTCPHQRARELMEKGS